MRSPNLILGLTLASLIGLPLAACTPAADESAPPAADVEGTAPEPLVESTTTPEFTSLEPSPEASRATSEPAASDAGAKMSLSETFTSTEFGVAIDYPTNWRVQDNGSMFMLKSYAEDPGPGTDGVSPTLTKIDILPLPGFALDLDARVAQIEDELDAIHEQEELTLIGGERAVWLRGEGGMAGDTGIIVTIVGNELYHLQAYGNPEPLKAIGFTFRAAE